MLRTRRYGNFVSITSSQQVANILFSYRDTIAKGRHAAYIEARFLDIPNFDVELKPNFSKQRWLMYRAAPDCAVVYVVHVVHVVRHILKQGLRSVLAMGTYLHVLPGVFKT